VSDSEVPGLAPERTALAWQRSGMAVVVTGLGIAKGVAKVPGHPGGGLLVIAMGVSLWFVAGWSARRRARAATTDRPGATPGDLVPISLGTLVFALAGIVLVFVLQ
jgi:uncharacterized membrane protein YidH (DUF202 family)